MFIWALSFLILVIFVENIILLGYECTLNSFFNVYVFINRYSSLLVAHRQGIFFPYTTEVRL